VAEAVIKQTSTDKALYDRIRHLEQELTDATLAQAASRSKTKGSKPTVSDHILGNYGHDDQQKYLEKECPKTSSAKEINTWTTRFLTKEQQRSVQSHSTKLKNYIQVLDKDTRDPPLPLWLRHVQVQDIKPSVRIAGEYHVIPQLPCQDPQCPRCDEKGGYKFHWLGPWTCRCSLTMTTADATRLRWMQCCTCESNRRA
jgi:hypothetical protein